MRELNPPTENPRRSRKHPAWRLGVSIGTLFVISCGSGSEGGTQPGKNSGIDFYDPKLTIDFGSIDPSIDPGTDPIFASDPELNQSEDYEYAFSKPGDHEFPKETCIAEFDAEGMTSLFEELVIRKDEFATCTGFALYLKENSSRLRNEDLRTLQLLNRPIDAGGIGAERLTRLSVYNLKSIQGGVECTPESAAVWPNSGNVCANTKVLGNHTWMWANGWAESWVRDLAMDDLEEAPDGAFCNAKFYTLSMRGLRSVGKMAFGEQPHGHLRLLYLPSVTTIGEHAFRRIQVGPEVVAKVVLPRVKTIGSYAFDDNTDLVYVSAPQLEKIGRNVFNDTGKLASVHMPKLRSMEHACFGINQTMKVLRLPSLTTLDGDGVNTLQELRFFHAPKLEYLAGGALGNNPKLEAVYLPRANRLDASVLAGSNALKRLTLPADGLLLRDRALAGTSLSELVLGGARTVYEGSPFSGLTTLGTIHFGEHPPAQSDTAFAGTSSSLVGYHTGNDADWKSFVFAGNPTARLERE